MKVITTQLSYSVTPNFGMMKFSKYRVFLFFSSEKLSKDSTKEQKHILSFILKSANKKKTDTFASIAINWPLIPYITKSKYERKTNQWCCIGQEEPPMWLTKLGSPRAIIQKDLSCPYLASFCFSSQRIFFGI